MPSTSCMGIFKSLFFGAAIALVSCHHGFHCEPGAEGVGRAATNAFVHSFVLILVLDLFLGIWLNNVHDFFRPEGPAGSSEPHRRIPCPRRTPHRRHVAEEPTGPRPGVDPVSRAVRQAGGAPRHLARSPRGPDARGARRERLRQDGAPQDDDRPRPADGGGGAVRGPVAVAARRPANWPTSAPATASSSRERPSSTASRSPTTSPSRSASTRGSRRAEIADDRRRARSTRWACRGRSLAKKPVQLSGGMRKRAGLARALALDPPARALRRADHRPRPDHERRHQRAHPAGAAAPGVTSVVVTHDMHTARKVADRIIMLYPLFRLAAGRVGRSSSTARPPNSTAAATRGSASSSRAAPAAGSPNSGRSRTALAADEAARAGADGPAGRARRRPARTSHERPRDAVPRRRDGAGHGDHRRHPDRPLRRPAVAGAGDLPAEDELRRRPRRRRRAPRCARTASSWAASRASRSTNGGRDRRRRHRLLRADLQATSSRGSPARSSATPRSSSCPARSVRPGSGSPGTRCSRGPSPAILSRCSRRSSRSSAGARRRSSQASESVKKLSDNLDRMLLGGDDDTFEQAGAEDGRRARRLQHRHGQHQRRDGRPGDPRRTSSRRSTACPR